MMKKWISLLLVAIVLMAFAPVALAEPEITEDSIVTIVNCKNYANVHVSASKESKLLGWAPVGNTYKLLGAEGSYYKIQYKKSQVGFVHKSLSKVGKKGDIPSGSKIATLVREPDSGNGVNIRDKASSKTGKILGVAHNGDKFEVTGKSGKWTKVIYNGGTAWIFTYYLSISGGSSSGGDTTPVVGEKAYIDCNYRVNVRKSASSSSKKLGTLNRGTEITVTGTKGKWTRIAYKDGTAYVFSKYVSSVKPDEDVAGKTATIINCNSFVNIREKASSSSKKLGTADKGSAWTVKGLSGKWVQVEYKGGSAYIFKKYVKIG